MVTRTTAPAIRGSRALATKAGIHESTLSRICHGHVKPSFELAKKIADAKGITLDELYAELPH